MEGELADRFRAGDPDAFGDLIGYYWHDLLTYAAGLLEDRDLAEDIVQDAVVELWRRRERWTGDGSFRPLLYRMVRNAALNERRRRRTIRSLAWRVVRLMSRDVPTPLETTEAAETEALVREAVEALPPRRREIFLLVRRHGLTYDEVADALDLSRQTVANQVSRALADLDHALGSHLSEEDPPSLVFPDTEAG